MQTISPPTTLTAEDICRLTGADLEISGSGIARQIEEAGPGARLYTSDCGGWFLWPAARPGKAGWLQGPPRSWAGAAEAGVRLVNSLPIGGECQAARGFHPRHGVKYTTVRRMA